MQINVGGEYSSHTDKNNYGMSMICLLGQFRRGEFNAAGGFHMGFENRMEWTLIDGSQPHWSAKADGFRVSTVAFYHTGELLVQR